MTDFIKLANEGIQGMHPYVGGKDTDELARELGLDPKSIVKLASNENPLGTSDAVKKAVAEAALDLTRYPDGSGFHLKQALSKLLGVDPKLITLGNGSSDLLHFIVEVFCQPGDTIMYSEHAFALYELIAQAGELKSIVTPAKNYGHDLDAMAAAINPDVKVVFITNPNNPTGTWFDEETLVRFLKQVPSSTVVVIDEAYYEFVNEPGYPNSVKLMEEFDNLLITRTFSKAYGLAGMRVGFGIANEQLTDLMNRIRPPFNVNQLALVAAKAGVEDQEFIQKSVENNTQGLAFYEREFKRLGLEFIPSVANFISVDVGPKAKEINQKIMEQGVTLRLIASYGLPNHIRISVGTPAENQRCIEALESALEEVSNG